MTVVAKCLPVNMCDYIFRLKSLFQIGSVKRNKRILSESGKDGIWVKRMSQLIPYGGKYTDYLQESALCRLKLEKRATKEPNTIDVPTVICIVKDDLVRMKLFYRHYRNMGIKEFVVLDDKSKDGTKEYLLEQKDTTVYSANENYNTLRRQVWINELIYLEGFNKWYLIVDSDELLDFHRTDYPTIKDLVMKLKSKKKTRAKALMLDMLAKDALFSMEVFNEYDIERKYNLFSAKYTLEKTAHGFWVRGGARGELFRILGQKKGMPVVSKYPLVYFDNKEIAINSHYNFPSNRNKPAKPSVILRHYKFLPCDKDKYSERVQKGNFQSGSAEYKTYEKIDKYIDYQSFSDQLLQYDGYASTSQISVLEKI